MNHDQQDKPSFFAIIKGNINQLKVPPKIVKNLGKELWKNELIILIGSSGEKWQVNIMKKENDMYLQNIGWENFVKDNSVMNGEFLFFTYNGENRFQVQIFGTNGLERPCFKKTKEEEEEVAAEAPVVVKRKRGRPRKNPAAAAETVSAKKEKEKEAPMAKIEKDSRVRKNPALERVCVKKEKEEASEAIVGRRKKDEARKYHDAKRVCVKKEKEKEEVEETMETKRKNVATPHVIIID